MDVVSPSPVNGSGFGPTSSPGPGLNSSPAPGAASSPGPGANSNSGPLTPIANKKPAALRNLQPRAAAALDFNDNVDSDEEFGGLLSEDYKAQRKTTKDLVDFLNSGPPEPPPGTDLRRQQQQNQKSNVTTGGDEEKKKWFFLQKLRSKKTNSGTSNVSSISLGNGNKKGSAMANGATSNISSISGMTMGRGKNGDVPTATLPNGKKYIMISVKEPDAGSINGSGGVVGSLPSPSLSPSSPGASALSVAASKRTSIMSNFRDDSSSAGLEDARRRSAIPNSGASESSLLLNGGHQRSPSSKSRGESGSIGGMSRNGSKRTSRVTFSTPRAPSTHLDDAIVSEALEQRIASHKAKQQQKASSTGPSSALVSTSTSTQDFPEITLPKPVSRKKVRHVQIQTQHSIMRPMYTQTEPYESLVQDVKVKDWSTQTTSTESISGSTEVGTSTIDLKDSIISSAFLPPPVKKDGISASTSVGSFASFATATDAETIPSPTTTSPQDELAQLRQQNAMLQSQVASLQRELAAEVRARTRTTAAMQDTRVKFEMLSEMAFQKLKEMIFHRQVLDKEMQELRAKVDMQSEANVIQQGEMLFRQEQLQMQMQMQMQQQQQQFHRMSTV